MPRERRMSTVHQRKIKLMRRIEILNTTHLYLSFLFAGNSCTVSRIIRQKQWQLSYRHGRMKAANSDRREAAAAFQYLMTGIYILEVNV